MVLESFEFAQSSPEPIASELLTDVLRDNGLVKYAMRPIKILGNGELNKKLDVVANSFSNTAKEKIEKAGGKVTEH